jgi:hypothetical protein
MALPSTIYGTKDVAAPATQGDQVKDWPPLPSPAESQERKATSAPDPVPIFQIPNLEKQKQHAGGILIMNEDRKTWFHPSKGLDVLFSRAKPKPTGIKSLSREALNPNRTHSSTQTSS